MTDNKQPHGGDVQYSATLRDALDSMSNSAKAILSIKDELTRRVPEPFFEKHLLPVLRGWILGEDVVIGNWLNVSNGPENEIIVVDDKNEEIFRCPPPFVAIRPRTELGNRGHNTAYSLLFAQGIMFDQGETRQAMAIDNELDQLITNRPEIKDKAIALAQLVTIWERYKLPMSEILGENHEKVLKTIKVSTLSPKSATPVAGAADTHGDDDEEDTFQV